MTEFQVLGITLTDHSVREAMRKVEVYLHDEKVSTICYITSSGLLTAESSKETRDFLENMNLTIAADAEVLKVAKVQTRARFRETKQNEFLRQFLHRITREGGGICLLCEKKEELEKLENGLCSYTPNLNITGRFALSEYPQNEDSMINEINVLAPKYLISNLESPVREAFFSEHHMKMHAEIWLILKHDMVIENRSPKLWERLRSRFAGKALRRSVDQYVKEEQHRKEELLKFDTQPIDTEQIERELAKNREKG
ncbi:MAG: WecB/TagA/CpsF family glycosyltransferase [Lachnospiraceae bacterium]|nr:WecB/TagA/CpsF family glycosyltransferase [Lachnospiraceae bacterium]